MTTATTTPALAQQITVLKNLRAGRDVAWTATVTHLPRQTVQHLADTYGDSPDRLGVAIDELTTQLHTIPAGVTDADRASAERAPIARPVTAPKPAPAKPPAPVAKPDKQTPQRSDDELAVLLEQARTSTKKSTRTLGDRIARDVLRLRERLHAEAEATAAAARADTERCQRQAKIAALKAELAQLQGKDTAKTGPDRLAKSRGAHPCRYPGCDRVLDTGVGRSAHERGAHDGWTPAAKDGAQ